MFELNLVRFWVCFEWFFLQPIRFNSFPWVWPSTGPRVCQCCSFVLSNLARYSLRTSQFEFSKTFSQKHCHRRCVWKLRAVVRGWWGKQELILESLEWVCRLRRTYHRHWYYCCHCQAGYSDCYFDTNHQTGVIASCMFHGHQWMGGEGHTAAIVGHSNGFQSLVVQFYWAVEVGWWWIM